MAFKRSWLTYPLNKYERGQPYSSPVNIGLNLFLFISLWNFSTINGRAEGLSNVNWVFVRTGWKLTCELINYP